MSRKNSLDKKVSRRNERSQAKEGLVIEKQSVLGIAEPKIPATIQEFIGSKGIGINQDGYTHFDYYLFDELVDDFHENEPIMKIYARAIFHDFAFKMGWHQEFDYDYVDLLLYCRELTLSQPSTIDSFCIFQNKSAIKVLEAIYSNPVEKRKFLLDEFYGRNNPTPKIGEQEGLWFNVTDIYDHPEDEFPYVITTNNGLQISIRQEEADKLKSLTESGENIFEYVDELWAKRKLFNK